MTTPELFEPAPPRRVIVAEGSTAWWGVDFSTRAVSVGAVWEVDPVPDDTAGREKRLQRSVVTISWPPTDGGARLAWAYDVVARTLGDHVRSQILPVPGLVGIERPSGKNVSEHLVHMEGILQGAVHAALVAAKVPVCKQVHPVPAHWKKLACGRGDIWKPKKGDTHEYGVLVWARSRGYTGSSWDEADALGIAEGLRREYALEPR